MTTSPTPNKLVLSITRAELERLCRLFGPRLELSRTVGPDGQGPPESPLLSLPGWPLDGARLLLSLAGRESSFGVNLKPRHEPLWDVGGSLWKGSSELKDFIALHGRAGACSYGPLQIMAFNARGCPPQELAVDPAKAMAAAAGYLQRYALDHWCCRSLKEICATWNAGHPGGTTTPGYVEEVTKYYLNETWNTPAS